jgi:hypothetical protein
MRGFMGGCAAAFAAGQVWAATLHVAPGGDDAADGSRERPLATLDGARERVKQIRRENEHVAVLFADGEYRLAAPVAFGAEDSNTLYAAEKGAKPVFTGGTRMPPFEAGADGVWRTRVPDGLRFEQLYVNGRRAVRARSPNRFYFYMQAPAPYGIDPLTGKAADLSRRAFIADRADIAPLAGKSRTELSNVVVRVFHAWEASQARVQAVEPESGRVVVTPSTPWAFFYWKTYLPRYALENFREALDEAGEWFLDEAGVLSYLPLPGEKAAKSVAVAPAAEAFIRIDGAQSLTFRGLAFKHAAWTMPPDGQGDPQAAVRQPAAVEADNARSIEFSDCEFAHTGAHGIRFRKNCRTCIVTRCYIHDTGGGAVYIGDTKWSPDELPGKLTGDIAVYNNILQEGGRVFPGAVGVWIGHASDVTVSHNDIGDFFYTGISSGWTWGYRETATHRINLAYNHIHDIGRGVLSDMGGVYTLGRSDGTRVANNHIHDVYSYDYTGRGGWGLYTDEGSAGLVFENNLVHHVKTGCIHQHYGRENIFRNNILACSMDGQIQRSRIEEHTTVIVTNNIVWWDNASAAFWRGHAGAYGSVTDAVVNANTYWNPRGIATNAFNGGSWEAWRAAGQDADSRIADPRFRDPAKGDFRFSRWGTSPAVKAGFKPFDYEKAGVTGPRAWRKLAAKHTVPPVEFAPQPERYVVRRLHEDFENLPVGAPFPNVTAHVEKKGDGIAVTAETAFSGRQSLKVQDAEGLTYAYNPHFTFGCLFTNAVVENRFAVRLTAGAEFFAEWRDYPEGGGNDYKIGPCLVFRDGKIIARTRGGERPVAELPAGTWAQVTVTAAVGPAADGRWSVRVARAGQPDAEAAGLPFASEAFKAVEWLGFCSTAKNKSAFYLDDFVFGEK